MKLYRYILGLSLIVALPLLTACSDDEEVEVQKVAPANTGVWVDERDGAEYEWVQYGKLQWMARNFRYNLKEKSRCADYRTDDEWINGWTDSFSSPENLKKYGMYYSFQGALDACPEGWRLPTDKEWQELEVQLGMTAGEAAAYGWRGNIASNMLTFYENTAALNLLLGGWYNYNMWNNLSNGSNYRGAWAFYWTSSVDPEMDGDYFMYRKLAYNQKGVYRGAMEGLNQLLSVRYVRDAQ